MPDIAMCEGLDCSINYRCFRFRAKPNEYRQSYIQPEFPGPHCTDKWLIVTIRKK